MRLSGRGPGGAHPQGRSEAEDGQEPGFLSREESAGTALGKKVGEVVARFRPVRGRPQIEEAVRVVHQDVMAGLTMKEAAFDGAKSDAAYPAKSC